MEKDFNREMALLANTDNPDKSTCKKQGDELQLEEGKKRRCSPCWRYKAQDALTPSQLLDQHSPAWRARALEQANMGSEGLFVRSQGQLHNCFDP